MTAQGNPIRWPPALWLVAAALVSGCTGPPPVSPLAFVARASGVVEARPLVQEVEGTWCFTETLLQTTLRPPWQVRLADTGRAVTRAIESVPGANVLTDVRVRTRIEQYLLFQRVCAVVIGDAGVVE